MLLNNGEYECDWCGAIEDEDTGNLWQCEICGKDFCEKCSTQSLPVSWWEPILCPDCVAAGHHSVKRTLETNKVIEEI